MWRFDDETIKVIMILILFIGINLGLLIVNIFINFDITSVMLNILSIIVLSCPLVIIIKR